ncbi:hypothetical protein [Veillonella sp. 3310]|uniref:hypothetical protein n=1 Tax=Veillonella sp. 3310 TaxID=2490956 RepID=UPI000FD65199|nr:hypothetical protein [Veillonella sp. 3310]
MTEKELVEYIQHRLDEIIDVIERAIENGDGDFETNCLYKYLIMQCNSTKSFVGIASTRPWRKKDLCRIYHLIYNSMLSIDLLFEYEKDNFGYYEYTDLDELLTDCMQTLSGQMLLTQ